MSLVGDDPRQTYGAVRNGILRGLYFPEWTLRIYVEQTSNDSTVSKISTPVSYLHPPVPTNVIAKLKSLPVQLVSVDTKTIKVDPSLWPLLALNDATVNYLLVRKPSSRLSERDAAVVSDWLDSGKSVHVIKDHPKHFATDIIPGLWGLRTEGMREIINAKMDAILENGNDEAHFLKHVLGPNLANNSLIHDLHGSDGSLEFSVKRQNGGYLGEEFGPFGEALDIPL